MPRVSAWHITVHTAAPLSPQPSVKMKSGWRAMLSSAPLTMPAMPSSALPWKRNWLFSASADVITGAPSRMVPRYSSA